MPTRTATVLFTDLVGSVETAARIGPTAADALRRLHDSLLTEVVTAGDGTVVKHLGDGLMATFDSASDGVKAAVAIQQSVHRHNQRAPSESISVRIGLSCGDVSFEQGDCFGTTVVEASRLCAAARGRQILAAGLVATLARGLAGDVFRRLDDLVLKGLPEPLPVVEVSWDLPEESRTPLQPRLASGRDFVGRVAEMELLDRRFRLAVDGHGRQLVLLHAEPGMGKSSLAIRAVERWHAAGASVALGACDEELSMPYAPFSAALDHLVRHAPAHVLTGHVGRHGGAARHLVRALADRVDLPPAAEASDQETERYLGFAAVHDLLVALGDDSPVVIVLEDLHWADAGTLTLMRHLAVNALNARLVVIATFRDSEVSPEHPLADTLAALRRLEGVARLALPGLDPGEVQELVSRRAGAALDATEQASIARKLAEETAGNPLYVTELLSHLVETGGLQHASAPQATWHLPSEAGGLIVPDSVREVIGARVGRLGPRAVELLTVAATIGTDFDLDLLASASDRPLDEVVAVVEEARASSLLREVPDVPGGFCFSHALVGHTLVQNAGPLRRAGLHQRVALAIEESGDTDARQAELAFHWGQAVHTLHAQRARDHARRAADKAVEALAPDEAARWYQRALELHDLTAHDDLGTRVDLLTSLALAQRQAGSARHRSTVLEASRLARDLGDARRLAAAMAASNRGMFSSYAEIDDEKVSMLETALAMLDPSDLVTRCELLAVLANELTYNGDYPRRRALADEALDLARRLGRPDLLFRVFNLVFHALWVPDTLHERVAMSAESIALAEAVGDPVVRFWAEHRHCINLVQAGLVDDADRCLGYQWDLAERLAQPLHRWVARFSASARRQLSGDFRSSEALATQALQLGQESEQPEAVTFFQINMMCVFWQSGRQFDIELGRSIVARYPGAPAMVGGLALLAADSGADTVANELLDTAASKHFEHLHPDPAYLTGLACFAEVSILMRRRDAAGALHGILSPWNGQIGFDNNTCVGPVSFYTGGLAGLLGRYDEAEKSLNDALEVSRRLGARFFEARCLVELGRVRSERGAPGDRDSALDAWAAARATAEHHGFEAVAARAAALAAAS